MLCDKFDYFIQFIYRFILNMIVIIFLIYHFYFRTTTTSPFLLVSSSCSEDSPPLFSIVLFVPYYCTVFPVYFVLLQSVLRAPTPSPPPFPFFLKRVLQQSSTSKIRQRKREWYFQPKNKAQRGWSVGCFYCGLQSSVNGPFCLEACISVQVRSYFPVLFP